MIHCRHRPHHCVITRASLSGLSSTFIQVKNLWNHHQFLDSHTRRLRFFHLRVLGFFIFEFELTSKLVKPSEKGSTNMFSVKLVFCFNLHLTGHGSSLTFGLGCFSGEIGVGATGGLISVIYIGETSDNLFLSNLMLVTFSGVVFGIASTGGGDAPR